MSDTHNQQEFDLDASTGTLADHWRKGIPTILLALLGLTIFCYSSWFVKPTLSARYMQTVAENLGILKLPKVLNENKSAEEVAIELQKLLAMKPTRDSSEDVHRSERLLEETQICLRRLLGKDNQNDALHLQIGIVDFAFSESTGGDLPNDVEIDGTNDEVDSMLARKRQARERVGDSLRKVEKLDGTHAATAAGWLVRTKLLSGMPVSITELTADESRLRRLSSKSGMNVILNQALAMTLIEIATRPTSKVTAETRKSHFKEAAQLFGDLNTVTRPMVRYLSYSLQSQDPSTSKTIASEAVQDYWLNPSSTEVEISNLPWMFDCMLLSGNPREAQLLMMDALSRDPAGSPRQLRIQLCESIVKFVFAQLMISENRAESEGKELASLVNYAMQVDAGSLELHELLRLLAAESSKENSRVVALFKSDSQLLELLKVLDRLQNKDFPGDQELTDKIASIPTRMVLSSIVTKQATAGSLDLVAAEKLVRAIASQAADLYSVWFDRASLLIQVKEYAQAIECLEYLQEKLPGNEEITSTIEGLKNGTIK